MSDRIPPEDKTFTVEGKTIKGEIISEFGPDFFTTGENAARVVLMQFQNAIKKQADWITLAAIIIALLSPFITADFKTFLSIDAIYWKILFAIGIALCIFKILNTIYSTIVLNDDSNIEKVIEKLRTGKTQIKPISLWQRLKLK